MIELTEIKLYKDMDDDGNLLNEVKYESSISEEIFFNYIKKVILYFDEYTIELNNISKFDFNFNNIFIESSMLNLELLNMCNYKEKLKSVVVKTNFYDIGTDQHLYAQIKFENLKINNIYSGLQMDSKMIIKLVKIDDDL